MSRKRTRPRLGPDPRWYAVQLLPQLEQTAAANLKRQNYTTFFPRLLVRKSRRSEQILPLFKGYCFIRFDPDEDQWRAINGTIGVVGLVPKFSLRPHPFERGYVERLIEKDPVTKTLFDEAMAEFYPGVTIRIKEDGHLYQGKTGEVVRDLGRLVEITFPWSANSAKATIEKASIETVEG